MRKNLLAIEVAVSIILLTMLLTGIFLKEGVIMWLAIALIVLGGLAVVILKILNLAKESVQPQQEEKDTDNKTANKKHIFDGTKKAWEYSTAGERIKSILFVFTILICSIAFIVLCSYGYIHAGLIVFASGIGLIVISLIAMAVIEKYLLKKHLKEEALEQNVNASIDEKEKAINTTELVPTNAENDNSASQNDLENKKDIN